MAYQDRTHQEYEAEAKATGADKVAARVYRQYTSREDTEQVAERIMRTLRKAGYSYTLAAHVAWMYS
jgi:hypothetical protein